MKRVLSMSVVFALLACCGVSTAGAAVAVTNLVFSDNFNAADGSGINDGLESRLSGKDSAVVYSADAAVSITNNQLSHVAGASGGAIRLNDLLGVRKNFAADVAGRKYAIEATVSASGGTSISDGVQLFWNDNDGTGTPEFKVQQIRGGGNIKLEVNLTSVYALNNPKPSTVKLVVDETGAVDTYEFFINGASVTNGTVAFGNVTTRNLLIWFTGGSTAELDNLSISVIENVVFRDSFNGADGSGINDGLETRLSGSAAAVVYSADAAVGITNNQLSHVNGDAGGAIRLNDLLGARKNFAADVAGRKYAIEATLSASDGSSLAQGIQLYWNDNDGTDIPELKVQQIRGGGNIALDVNLTTVYAQNNPKPSTVRLVVDETKAVDTYEFFVNGVSVTNGAVGFGNTDTRHLLIWFTVGATAEIDDISLVLLEEVAPGFESWVAQYSVGSQTNRTDNPDGDRLNNLYEWALGGNPADDADQGFGCGVGLASLQGTNYLAYVYAKRDDAAELGLSYEAVLNSDLVSGSWTNDGSCLEIEGAAIGTGFHAVTNLIPTDVKERQFIGLHVAD